MFIKTGVFHSKNSNRYYHFLDESNVIRMELVPGKKSGIDFLLDDTYPIWILRHSLGKDIGEEDYSKLSETDYLTTNRSKVLGLHQKGGSLRDLFYHGLKVPMSSSAYSHAVGPIHAGIIEPGHFRFSVEGEIIRHLSIRLGFQSRGILEKLKHIPFGQFVPVAETISGDTSLGYAVLFSRLLEKMFSIQVSKNANLFRGLLNEVERIAIHIGDLGALAEDIGYYPLFGVCATDRGAALGLMESWTGSRFGKGSVRPGGLLVNKRIKWQEAKDAAQNLQNIFKKNIEPQVLRALSASTIRERLQSCGIVPLDSADKFGFLGPVARAMGSPRDTRNADDSYQDWVPLHFHEERENLKGDAWARFYLRYLEIQQSLAYIQNTLPKIDFESLWSESNVVSPLSLNQMEPLSGVYFSSFEAWRGNLLAGIEIQESDRDLYVRDASVPNWHALEMAVREEQIGDFPLNNKSFNLSYVGFDL